VTDDLRARVAINGRERSTPGQLVDAIVHELRHGREFQQLDRQIGPGTLTGLFGPFQRSYRGKCWCRRRSGTRSSIAVASRASQERHFLGGPRTCCARLAGGVYQG